MLGVFRTPDDDRWYRLALGGLVLSAWGALAVWGASPFAGLLSHRAIEPAPLPAVLRLLVFVVGWLLMTVAMMLPSSLPLINLFRKLVAHRPDHRGLVLRLILGYLGVWVLFGTVAYLGDTVVHQAVHRLPSLAAAAWRIGAAILLVAGAYQFTSLKHMCLQKCRSPYSFLVEHWRGRQARRDAVRLGVQHGAFCVGCCWTLMLLMFAIGGATLGWMLALGAVMAAERATRWGHHLTKPVGVALTAFAILQLTGVLTLFPGE